MENNNFDIDAILDEIMPDRHLPLEERINNLFINPNNKPNHNLPKKRINEIFNDCIREIKNPNNNLARKLEIMDKILTFDYFRSKYKNKILYNTLINEANTTQDNDYKFKILNYISSFYELYAGYEEQLYNYSIELINNENYANRINKAAILLKLLYKPVLIQNHEDELCNFLEQFHDEIINTNYLRVDIAIIYDENIDFFINHRQYVEDLYNERQQIEERERMKGKRERRATFYNENKPLTSFMQEIMCPMCISFEDFEALPLEQLVSNVDNAYVALRKDKDNIGLQNNLANARNEFLNALRTLNDEDKGYLLAGIYQGLEQPVIFIMETNNKKHDINKELKEKTGICVENLEEIFKQKQQDIETEKNQQNQKGEQNNNLEENFIEIARIPQPQVQELHDNNNSDIAQVEEENNNEQNQEVQNIKEEIQEIIQEVQQQQNNNQQQNRHFIERLQEYNQKKQGRCSCM